MAAHENFSEQHLRSLSLYSHAPIEAATDVAESEYNELIAEQEALKTFVDRVSSLNTDSVPKQSLSSNHFTQTTSPTLSQIKQTYYDTIMTLEHHSDVYDQPVREDFADELGEELAGEVFAGSKVLTNALKQLIITTSRQRIRERDAFINDLEAELEDLQYFEKDLTTLLRNLSCFRISNPCQSEVLCRLETLAEERQLALQNAQSFSNRHCIFNYLYQDQQWTYPVLTAIGRVRSVFTIG